VKEGIIWTVVFIGTILGIVFLVTSFID